MLEFAFNNPDKELLVTKLGSSLAGYTVNEIKGLFQNLINIIPNNVILPVEYEVRKQIQPTNIKSAQQVIPDTKVETLYNPVHGGSLQELVIQIQNKSSNPMFKELAGYLKDKISNEKISIKKLGIDGGRIDNGHISISNQFTSNEEFERVLLHEVVHLLTLQKLQDKGNIDIKKNLINLKLQARKVIADKYGITDVQKAAEQFKKDKTLTSEQRKVFYGILTISEDASGVDEFVTQIMTEPEFQKLLGETKAEGFDHSMLQRFFNLIKRLLIRTGILPESITAQAINQVLTLIEGNVQPEVIKTNTTVSNTFLSGLQGQTETKKEDSLSSSFLSGLKSPATTFEDFKKQLKKTCK
jgi:hypothetical protein